MHIGWNLWPCYASGRVHANSFNVPKLVTMALSCSFPYLRVPVTLMYNEFGGSSFGEMVLKSYEIEDTNIRNDMVVLLFYSVAIHCVSVAVLLISFRGTNDEEAKRLKKNF